MPIPDDPVTFLQAGVAQQHEMFMAYVDAGFTRREALQILIAVIIAHLSDPDDN